MRAVVYTEYGSPDEVLKLQNIDKPVVKDNEVLVRIHAAGLNPADWHFMRGSPYIMRLLTGLSKPKKTTIIGSDMAGNVEAVGKKVTQFKPGDEVFAEVGSAAGLPGGCAEYGSFPEKKLGMKPTSLTFEQAAAVPLAAQTALIGVRDVGNVQPSQKVLINGSSGGVGTFAVQIAKSFGAEVTGVCSTRNVDTVRSIGADHVIDYTKEDFTQSGQRYDFILDNVGNHSMSEFRRILMPKGTYGAPGAGGGPWFGPMTHQLKASLTSLFVSQKMSPVNDKPNRDLDFLKELIETGKIKPVIDRTYSLNETPEAIRHLEGGHVRGKIVITVN